MLPYMLKHTLLEYFFSSSSNLVSNRTNPNKMTNLKIQEGLNLPEILLRVIIIETTMLFKSLLMVLLIFITLRWK